MFDMEELGYFLFMDSKEPKENRLVTEKDNPFTVLSKEENTNDVRAQFKPSGKD